jgi:hypothetical protein
MQPPVAEPAAPPVGQPVPPISGPSILGLNQALANRSSPSRNNTSQPSANQTVASQPSAARPAPSLPSIDLLRETSFSGFDSFMEHEEPKSGVGRILLLLALLAGLGIAGWWTYTNYVGATESRKLQAAISNADNSSADKPAQQPQDAQATRAAAQDGNSAQTTPPQTAPSPAATSPAAAADTDAKPAAPKPAAATPASPKSSPAHKTAVKHEPLVAVATTPSRPEPAPADTGDAAFRRGEAYLYGRGVRENCDEAMKNLKIASSQSNAKARSTLGTMYATGHCVPRDLPTSYLWFALALRVDSTNQILEKDLNAIWNQMTPPERQQATRMKQ